MGFLRQKKDKDNWECLNIGKCKDVGKEILYDLGYLHYLSFINDGTKPYINQLKNTCNFKYKKGKYKNTCTHILQKNILN